MLYTQSLGFSYFSFNQDPKFKIVTKSEDLETMMNQLRSSKQVAIDYETNGLAWWRGKRPCGVSFTVQTEETPSSFYVPFRHITGQEQLPPEKVIAAQKEIFENKDIEKIAHNAKFETHMSRVDGIKLQGSIIDTMIEARLYNEDALAGLKERLILDLNDHDSKDYEDQLSLDIHRLGKNVHGMGVKEYKNTFGFAELDIYLCGAYAARDTLGCWKLHKFYEEKGVRSYYSTSPRGPEFRGIYDIEMKLVAILAKMEEIGQPLDIEYIKDLHSRLTIEKEKAEIAFFSHFKCEYFNLASDDQLREFLQKKLKLKWEQTTESGAPAVDYDVISDLIEQVPQLDHLLRYKEVEKKISTYTLSLIDLSDENGILHCDYQQAGANTGRLSCRKPNLQNISSDDPQRAKENNGIDPESVKRAFIVQRRDDDPYVKKVGKTKLVRQFWDYSQVELRVLADYTKDTRLVNAYLEDKDIHNEVELAVFGTGTTYSEDGKKIDGPNRRKAKIISFGISFQMSAFGFIRQIKGTTLEEAEGYLNEYNVKFPGVPAFREALYKFIRMNGCQFDNKFGQTRHLPGIVSNDYKIRKRNERMAIATIIQGTAARFTKQSLVLMDEYFTEKGLSTVCSQTIHDEIQTDGPIEEFAEVAKATKRIMEYYPDFCIPIKVDGKYSITHWSDKDAIPGLK